MKKLLIALFNHEEIYFCNLHSLQLVPRTQCKSFILYIVSISFARWKFNFHTLMTSNVFTQYGSEQNVSEIRHNFVFLTSRAAQFMIYLKCFPFARIFFAFRWIGIEIYLKCFCFFLADSQLHCFTFYARRYLMWNMKERKKKKQNLLKIYWVYDLC